MTYPISSALPLVLTVALISHACGRSKNDRESDSQSTDPLVPAGFQNTADRETLQQKNQEAQRLLQSVETQFGMKVQDSKANGSALIMTQAALQAFVGAKADSNLLSRSLELDASLTLITRLVSDDQPDSCTVVLSSVEALYTTLTLAASEAVNSNHFEQMQKTAQRLGMQLEERPASADAALAFHMTGTNKWPGLSLNQELDFSAAANDRHVVIKREAKFSSTLTRPGQDDGTGADAGHYTYSAKGGLSADLVQKQLVIIDQRQADFDMTRNEASIRGSSHFDVQTLVQGGDLPSMTTELNLNLEGQGLVDDDGFALFNEKSRFTSQLAKVDANTIRLNLALASEGAKGAKNLAVEWLLQKNADGTCTVSRPAK